MRCVARRGATLTRTHISARLVVAGMRAARPAFVLAGLLLVLALPPVPAVGAFVGSGPTTNSSYDSDCYQLATVILAPSPIAPGKWAAQIDCVYSYPFNTGSLSTGHSSWPAHVANALEGTPETGFVDAGTANVRGTSPGTVDWQLTIGPVGAATGWSLYTIFHPDPDYLGMGESHHWWNGTADFVGTSV